MSPGCYLVENCFNVRKTRVAHWPEYAFLNKCELVADSTVQKLLLFTSSHQLTWLLIFQLPDGCANLQHSFICLRCTK